MRQSIFSCLTCNPPPASSDNNPHPAALCYSCSISCHGEHDLVELFTKRDIVCDCGTSRLPASAPCTLRLNPSTGQKGQVSGETPREGNKYNHNYAGKFCACGEVYDPAKEKGTMFQCLGLADVEHGGCGEDWWHPECLMGLPRITTADDTKEQAQEKTQEQEQEQGQMQQQSENQADPDEEAPLPPGFPAEDDFDHLICYKCVASSPWIKAYAASSGFLDPIFHKHPITDANVTTSAHLPEATANTAVPPPGQATKRKADEEQIDEDNVAKKTKVEEETSVQSYSAEVPPAEATTTPKHASLPSPPSSPFTLFVKEDFRDHFCRCPQCFPTLAKYPQLLEEEESYEPPVSESDAADANGGASVGSGSTYERGEALLSNVDRVRAIGKLFNNYLYVNFANSNSEGVMVYNQLRDKVKTFLQPFAESGQAVGAEDIKAYFEKLRGDDQAIKLAAAGAPQPDGDENDNRREQSGGSILRKREDLN